MSRKLDFIVIALLASLVFGLSGKVLDQASPLAQSVQAERGNPSVVYPAQTYRKDSNNKLS